MISIWGRKKGAVLFMKKLIVIFIAALVVVFALGAVYAMNQMKEEIATTEYNPYEKTN